MKKTFLICGNYGAGNLGDELILKGMIKQIKKACEDPRIIVMSAFPRWTKAWHVVSAVYPMPFGVRSCIRGIWSIWGTLRAIYRCDVFILGGGGLLTDEEAWYAPFLWAYQVMWAKIFRKSVYVYANTIGPFLKKKSQKIAAWVLKKAEIVTVRDQVSFEKAKEMGRETHFTADPIFILEEFEILNKKYVQKNEVVLIKREGGKWNKLLNKNTDQTMESIKEEFGSNVRKESLLASRKLLRQFLSKKIDQFGDILQNIVFSKMVITNRLHAIYLCIIFGIPFRALQGPEKIQTLLHEIGQEISREKLQETHKKLKTRAESEISYLEVFCKTIDR